MAKKVIAIVKLQVPGGQASPAPPVGPALGQHGANIMEFVKTFNAKTQNQNGVTIPVEITIFADKSFTFITKSPPASYLIKDALGLKAASAVPNRDKVGTISKAKVKEIAELKMEDLNAKDVEGAIRMVAGTARSMGIEVEE